MDSEERKEISFLCLGLLRRNKKVRGCESNHDVSYIKRIYYEN